MDIDCVCDYDAPEFSRRHTHKARKEYRCEECGRKIRPGEPYEYVFGKWEGYIGEFKTCSHCVAMRTFMHNSVPCFCWAHGNMREDLKEALDDAYGRARDEVRGLAFRLGRMEIERRRMEVQ